MNLSRTDAAEGFKEAVSAVGSVISSVRNFVAPPEPERKFASSRSMPGFGSDPSYNSAGGGSSSNQGFQSYHNSSAGFNSYSNSTSWTPKSRKDSWDWDSAASKKKKKNKKRKG